MANFGYIKYFININSSVFIVIIDLHIVSTITQDIKGRPCASMSNLKRQGFFYSSYFEINFTNRFLLIKPNDIICKCLVFQLSSENLQLSEFDIESDFN